MHDRMPVLCCPVNVVIIIDAVVMACREYADEQRVEKQVAAVMQKTLEHAGSNGRKFFYAISRSACHTIT